MFTASQNREAELGELHNQGALAECVDCGCGAMCLAGMEMYKMLCWRCGARYATIPKHVFDSATPYNPECPKLKKKAEGLGLCGTCQKGVQDDRAKTVATDQEPCFRCGKPVFGARSEAWRLCDRCQQQMAILPAGTVE